MSIIATINNKFHHLIKYNGKLPECQYKYPSDPFEYWLNLPSTKKFECHEPSIENSNFCFFHDKDHYTEYEQKAANRFKEKVSDSISLNRDLECIGYYLPAINFPEKRFPQPVYFNEAIFYGEANFSRITFSNEANFDHAEFSRRANFRKTTFLGDVDFTGAKFLEEADFSNAKFSDEATFSECRFQNADFTGANFSENADFTGANFSNIAHFYTVEFSKNADFTGAYFNEVIFSQAKFLAQARFLTNQFARIAFFQYIFFEKPNKVRFDESKLGFVSFARTDITRIRFDDKITWGGEDGFTIIEEDWLRNKAKVKTVPLYQNVSLELVLSVYRNLRENYEFRLRYDDAGTFFTKEMELKRKYREVTSENGLEIKENGWFRRHFSLSGLYYHLSRYGESISRPAIVGAITVLPSTLFWVTQSNPTLEPHFDPSLVEAAGNSTFVGFEKAGNATQWLKGFERSLAGFLPFLSAGGETQVGIIDYIIKIFGGGLTFVLLAIALRRKFERKYTR